MPHLIIAVSSASVGINGVMKLPISLSSIKQKSILSLAPPPSLLPKIVATLLGRTEGGEPGIFLRVQRTNLLWGSYLPKLHYYARCKMITVKNCVLLDFWGRNRLMGGSCPRPLWLRAWKKV